MLKRILTLHETNEILNSSLIDVLDQSNVTLNVGMDQTAFDILMHSKPSGTKIYLKDLPYIKDNFILIITTSGNIQYYPKDTLIIDYDSAKYDCENFLCLLDENSKIVKHSKYVYNKNSKKLVPNALFEEDYIIVP